MSVAMKTTFIIVQYNRLNLPQFHRRLGRLDHSSSDDAVHDLRIQMAIE